MKATPSNLNHCDICNKDRLKDKVTLRTIDSKRYSVCEECWSELQLTRQCMKISADTLCEKWPERYERVSTFVVSHL